ncbi:MAG: diguanylate cyclase [Anaerolineales bacterium]|nr:diguanylate cyclase [Anaerolineales bacterium]
MQIQLHPYILPLSFSAIISGIIAITAWHRRNIQGATPLAVLMLALTLWSGAYALMWAGATEYTQSFWLKIVYFGVVIAPLSFFVFVARTTDSNWLKPHHIIGLSLIPVIILLLVWTNSLHHFFFSSEHASILKGFLVIERIRGQGFWIYVAYSYGLLLGGTVVLLREIKRASVLLRAQLTTILIGSSIPWLASIYTHFWFIHYSALDLTPIAFSISGFLFAYAIFMQSFLDLVPVARNFLVEKMMDGLLVVDANLRILDINPSAEKTFGILAKDVLGKDGTKIFPQWAKEFHDVQSSGKEFRADVHGGISSECRYDLTITPFRLNQPHVAGYLIIFRDITHHWNARDGLQDINKELEAKLGEINALQDELREQAMRDSLTGVYNRRFLEDALNREIPRAVEQNYPLCIIMMDLDHFKDVNDIYGHKAGDLILNEVADKIKRAIRDGDLACRYGGDEFIIILPNVTPEISCQRAEQIRQNIVAIAIKYKVVTLKVTSSLGVSVFPEHGSSADLLMRAADKALYYSKQQGRNCVTMFDPNAEMNTLRLKMPPD